MKKIAISLILTVAMAGSLFAQEATETTTTTSTTVETSSGVKRVVETRDGETIIITRPERKVTTTIPKRVIVRESLDAFFALGLRSSLDYHLSPGAASVSCLWIFGEVYTKNWGAELGIGSVAEPITSDSDQFGNTYNGTGTNKFLLIDLIGKYYFWFAPRMFSVVAVSLKN